MIYRAEDWEHGLRCGRCSALFTEGEEFAAVPEGLTGDGIPIETIVCVPCATGVAA